MKIVQIITKLDTVGGAQSHVLALTKQLSLDGHEVTILTSKGDLIEQALEEKNIKIIQLKYLKWSIHIIDDSRAFMEIRANLRRIKPDVVALHSSKAGVVGRLAAFSLKIPTVFTAHGWAFTEGVKPLKRLLFQYIEKVLARKTSRIIAVSNYDCELAIQKKVVKKTKITTIHNGIQSIEEPSYFQNKVPKIVMVARFEHPKRQDLLVEVLSTMKEMEWELVFIGDGREIEAVKELTKQRDIAHRVTFLGSRDDIEVQLSYADLFVLLSNFEGLPIAILEAMRAGLPVIASNVGGTSELVNHGKSGYVVDGNITTIREYLIRVLESQSLRMQLGYTGRRYFEENFLFQKMYEKTVNLYQEIQREQKVEKEVQQLDHNRA
ncbi:glycosyltransferase family 4 protein [Viridibacillus sp. YIM B01967]|uniref:Glycosyltransferase family 4 protein n=1 Tax=Viridibacillus soli TaxID=2798301 RepID=A0ABS1H2V0_9BACL|nr:glycosyltransferase family 4 protein [Viridibacillus soli]MBK3493730.1 glycosyltransferase family 4 protein [Viridibacillus soli]